MTALAALLPTPRPPAVHGLEVLTEDGYRLAARVFLPSILPRAAVLIVPAMGVPQSYYEAVALWLADEGHVVMTFDYRGMGRSRRGPLAELEADIETWARWDCAAMIDALAAEAPGLPLLWIGHSLGGQILPFVPNRARVAKMITVGTGSGYWRENSPPLKRRSWLFWFVAAPLATPLYGYFPGQRLGMVGDLPRGVIRQWRRWCLHPDYAVGVGGDAVRALYDSVTQPIVSLSFTDDEFMSARNTASLHGFYRQAPCAMVRIAPRAEGVARIGHFGFFRAEHAGGLWPKYLRPALSV